MKIKRLKGVNLMFKHPTASAVHTFELYGKIMYGCKIWRTEINKAQELYHA